MLIFKKEKQVVELALRHADKTGECLKITSDAVKAYLGGDTEKLSQSTRQVNGLESEADDLLREIRELLYSGAYLPTIRGDIYSLLSAVDSVTNRIENCLDFVNYQQPAAASNYEKEFGDILDLTLACFGELRHALKAFFKPKGQIEDLREHAKEVGELESRIDSSERALTKRIFDSDRELAEKQHVATLLTRIARISDRIENTAEELELLSLKSII